MLLDDHAFHLFKPQIARWSRREKMRRPWAGLSAKRKGREARDARQPESACPYADLRGGRHGNQITFSRAFIRAWTAGWRERDKEIDRAMESSTG